MHKTKQQPPVPRQEPRQTLCETMQTPDLKTRPSKVLEASRGPLSRSCRAALLWILPLRIRGCEMWLPRSSCSLQQCALGCLQNSTNMDWEWNVVQVPLEKSVEGQVTAWRCLFYGRPTRPEHVSSFVWRCLTQGRLPTALLEEDTAATHNAQLCGASTQKRQHDGSHAIADACNGQSVTELLRLVLVFWNLPMGTRREDLEEACSSAGPVRWAFIEHSDSAETKFKTENVLEKQKAFRIRPNSAVGEPAVVRGYVCFESPEDAQRTLNSPDELKLSALSRRTIPKLKQFLPVQLRGALEVNSFPHWAWLRFKHDHLADIRGLEGTCDRIMAAYEQQVRKIQRDQERKRCLVDEDGFTLVVPRTHKQQHVNNDDKRSRSGNANPLYAGAPQNSRGESVIENVSETKAAPVGFYRFQRDELKKRELAELRAQFERDRHRLHSLRATRQTFLS